MQSQRVNPSEGWLHRFSRFSGWTGVVVPLSRPATLTYCRPPLPTSWGGLPSDPLGTSLAKLGPGVRLH